MVRKVLAGVAVALLFLAPGLGLMVVAALVGPTVADAAGCSINGAGLVRPSLSGTGGAVPASLTAIDAHGQPVILDHQQLMRAATIIAVGESEDVGEDAQLVALMAALTESGLRLLSNVAAQPDSGGYPNDGDGHDHDSLGLFQMRPATGWGTVAQLMDPVWSTRAFYGGPDGPNHGSPAGLRDIPGWQQRSLGVAAQAVEVSAFPDRYAANRPVAEKIAAALTGATLPGTAACPTGTGSRSGPRPAGFAGAFIAAAEEQVGLPYVWGGGTYTGPSGIGSDGRGPGFDCSGLVLYAAYRASDGTLRLPHYTGDQIREGRPVAWADKEPGDLIFYTYRGNSEPHHVVIYLGGDRILHAPQTGQNVGYGSLSDFGDEITTVRRLG